jgi:hypothetical protein
MGVEIIAGAGMTVALGVVGYFLKKTHDKIEGTSTAITALSKEMGMQVDLLKEKIAKETKTSRDEIVEIFQDICHERQGACARLQEAKLVAVENASKATCAKLQALASDRERRWEKQGEVNDRFKAHLLQAAGDDRR